MEALQPGDAKTANASRQPPEAASGYLAQPDMAELIQAALELGWTLWRYEADIDHAPADLVEHGLMSQAFTNWREVEQAHNLARVLAGLGADDRLLVWCGNSHASKMAHDDWTSMGYEFAALVAEEAFVIDQTLQAMLGRFFEASGEYSFENHAYLADDEHGIVLQRGTMRRGGQTFSTNEAFVVHFRDGKISEFWYQPWDQAGVDAWFGT